MKLFKMVMVCILTMLLADAISCLFNDSRLAGQMAWFWAGMIYTLYVTYSNNKVTLKIKPSGGPMATKVDTDTK